MLWTVVKLQTMVLVLFFAILVGAFLTLAPRKDTARLNADIKALTASIDSIDKKVKRDTVNIVTLRETIRTYEKARGDIEQTVVVLPSNMLAKMFHDTVTKYGRRKE